MTDLEIELASARADLQTQEALIQRLQAQLADVYAARHLGARHRGGFLTCKVKMCRQNRRLLQGYEADATRGVLREKELEPC